LADLNKAPAARGWAIVKEVIPKDIELRSRFSVGDQRWAQNVV